MGVADAEEVVLVALSSWEVVVDPELDEVGAFDELTLLAKASFVKVLFETTELEDSVVLVILEVEGVKVTDLELDAAAEGVLELDELVGEMTTEDTVEDDPA